MDESLITIIDAPGDESNMVSADTVSTPNDEEENKLIEALPSKECISSTDSCITSELISESAGSDCKVDDTSNEIADKLSENEVKESKVKNENNTELDTIKKENHVTKELSWTEPKEELHTEPEPVLLQEWHSIVVNVNNTVHDNGNIDSSEVTSSLNGQNIGVDIADQQNESSVSEVKKTSDKRKEENTKIHQEYVKMVSKLQENISDTCPQSFKPNTNSDNHCEMLTASEVVSNVGSNIDEQNDIFSASMVTSDILVGQVSILANVDKEVLNNKELLDILEGKDESEIANPEPANLKRDKGTSKSVVTKRVRKSAINMDPIVEHTLALKQLTELPSSRRKSTHLKLLDVSDVQIPKPIKVLNSDGIKMDSENDSVTLAAKKDKSPIIKVLKTTTVKTYTKKPDDIVKHLVAEWNDDTDHSTKIEASNTTAQVKSNLNHNVDSAINNNQLVADTTIVKAIISEDTGQTPPQRRMSRIIKKKVIFDPDNPATFTPASSAVKKTKNIEKLSESLSEDDEETDSVIEVQHTAEDQSAVGTNAGKKKIKKIIMKSKVLGKNKAPRKLMKDIKKKKMTEIDRLLMDEGAVNMMYQLERSNNNAEGPEVSKRNKKTIKSKAAIIKKAVISQSTISTVGSAIKMFRARKEMGKPDEMPAKKSSQLRVKNPTRESVKSPYSCDDFATQSADDSIIIRRHSSSSYSSSCLSPRRLSDIEATSAAALPLVGAKGDRIDDGASPKKKIKVSKSAIPVSGDPSLNTVGTLKETLDKKDCLTYKQKFNSKLSRVLSFKRKRDVSKTHRLKIKQQKLNQKKLIVLQPVEYKQISINIIDKIARITIGETGSNDNEYNMQTLRELQAALEEADQSLEASVTIVSSKNGNLCSGLDLRPVCHTAKVHRVEAASELLGAVRSFLLAMEAHSKPLCVSVDGKCMGLGLAMLPLSDVAVASDRATFSAAAITGQDLIVPGIAVLISHCRSPNPSVSSELVMSGRWLSATEALARGLVSRTLRTESFQEELQALVSSLAVQPLATLLLKKKLLSLKSKSSEIATLRACLDAEHDLLIEYWSSEKGQVAIGASLNVPHGE